MKKILLLTIVLGSSLPVFANLEGDGYYRVKNLVTDRYVTVVDNRGRIDFVATSADLQAITLERRFELIASDPASVLYIEKKGSEYNISAQGTSIYDIINHNVKLEQNGSNNGQNLYMAYGVYDGVTRFLGDGNTMGGDFGEMSVTTTGNYRKWFILPITPEGDNYLGVSPNVDATAGSYQGLYSTINASFPISAYSQDVQFYTVDRIGDWGQVTLREITEVIPGGTPVIVKCAGESSADNRLNVGGEGKAVDGNSALKGVYFNCGKGGHINRVAYDAKTMRVLGVCADGSLGFVQVPLDYIPANTAYLTVPEGSPSEFKCVADNEFSSVSEVGADNQGAGKTVYTMTGIKIGSGMTPAEISSLPAGMYVIGGKKVVIR